MKRYYNPYELYHHGIKGQKWGVRKYQNADGSLTNAGRLRYQDGSTGRDKTNITSGNGNIHRRGEGLGTGPVGQGGRPVGTGPTIGGGGYAKPPEDIPVTVISGGHSPLTNEQIQVTAHNIHQMSASSYSEFRKKYQPQINNGRKKTELYLKRAVTALVNGVKKILGFIKSLFSPKK